MKPLRKAPPPRRSSRKEIDWARKLRAPVEEIAAAAGLSLPEALRVKENYLAKLRELEFEEKSGHLVDKAKAVQTVFNLAKQERDAWLSWPARISALMAADLSCDPHSVQTALNSYVRKHLNELSEIRFEVKESR